MRIKLKPITLDLKKILLGNEFKVFFVGAGISINPPSNLLTVREIMAGILNFLKSKTIKFQETELAKILDNICFEEFISFFFNFIDKDKNLLDYFSSKKEYNNIHYFLAERSIQNSPIITTNFDILIEIALTKLLKSKSSLYKNYEKKINLLIYDKDFKAWTKSSLNKCETISDDLTAVTLQNCPIIIAKLHGSSINYFKNKNTLDSIAIELNNIYKKTKEDLGSEFLGLSSAKRFFLKDILKDATLIVMGYSANDKLDIIPELKKVSVMRRIIWLEYEKRSDASYSAYKIEGELVEALEDFEKNTESLQPNNISTKKETLDEFLFELKHLHPNMEIIKIRCDLFRYISKFLNIEIKIPSIKKANLINEFMSWLEINLATEVKEGFVELFFGVLFNRVLNSKKALKFCNKALKIFEQEKNFLNILYCKQIIAQIYANQGETKICIELNEEILKLLEDFRNRSSHINEMYREIKASTLHSLGVTYYFEANLDKALNTFNEAFNIAKVSKNFPIMASALSNIGLIYKTRGNLDKALDYYQRSLNAFQLLGDVERSGQVLANIGEIFYIKNDLDIATSKYSEVLKIGKIIHNPNLILTGAINLGNIYKLKQQFKEALEFYKTAKEMCIIAHNPNDLALTLGNIANIYMEQSKSVHSTNARMTILQSALDLYQKSKKIYENTNNIKYLAIVIGNMANIYFALMKFKKSIEYYNRSYELEKQMGNIKGMSIKLYNLGNLYMVLGDKETALDYFTRALELSKKSQYTLGIKIIIAALEDIFRNGKKLKKFLKKVGIG
ncbi:MAG: tetratricopeptide repeat protein [Promethearchaeota archaeon]